MIQKQNISMNLIIALVILLIVILVSDYSKQVTTQGPATDSIQQSTF